MKIRIGNDFRYNWVILWNEEAESFTDATDKRLTVTVYGRVTELMEGTDYTITGHTIAIDFTPAICDKTGSYNLALHYTKPSDKFIDGDRRSAVDVDAFIIVPKSEQSDSLEDITHTSDAVAMFLDVAYQKLGEIEAAEAVRETAEEGRVTAETGRVTAETGRVTAEQQREIDSAAAVEDAIDAATYANEQGAYAEEMSAHPPVIIADYWHNWNFTTNQYESTGQYARGDSAVEGALVVQETGQSAVNTMSQKAVTDELDQLAGEVAIIDAKKADNSRIDEIITTPVESISAQEVIDARQGELSLGANLTHIKTRLSDIHYNVRDFGATGDGITDDTASVLSAIQSANGHQVFFTEGVYVLDNLALTGDVDILLDSKATLLAKPNTTSHVMIVFSNANSLKIEGGTIDGNVVNRNVVDSNNRRPYVITGHCQEGKSLIIRNVKVKNSVTSFAYIQEFGGYIDISNNIFTDQAEATGTLHHDTSILKVISGQDGALGGLVRFNHNRCIGTATPALDGASPGGIFLNNALTTPSQGNMSTLEAIGNYFYGYGLMCGGNDISPIHTYPTWGGVRVIGNYFEQCGFCAISAKSAENFVCANNVIVNGQISTMNIASEGAISYVPGYQAGTNARPHASITGNIIDSPGEQTGVGKQYGITVSGTGTSLAQSAVVANNVINNAGVGIAMNYAENIKIANNIINGAEDGATGSEHGIRLDNIQGDVSLSGNDIVANNGYGITGQVGLINARLFLDNNKIKHGYGASPTMYGLVIFGAKVLKLSGNTFDSAGTALTFRKDANNNKIKQFIWDDSNTILAGGSDVRWADIEKSSGFLQGNNSPKNIITPGEIGAMYRQTNGSESSVIWVATGLTSYSWAPLLDGGSGTPIIEPLTALGTDGTVAIIGNDSGGRIDATVGTTPTGTAIAKITFSKAKASIPKGVILTPAEGNAAGKIVIVYNTTIKTTDFSISVPASNLVPGTSYKWYYNVLV